MCPFCDQRLPTTSSGPVLGLVLGVAVTACGPAVGTPEESGPASTMDADGGSSGASTPVDPSTTAMPTSSSTAGISDTGEAESSSSTGFDTGSDDDNGASSVGFYGGPGDIDFPNTPFECDIWEPDCPEGEKCSAWANDGGTEFNATRCAPVAVTPDQVGEECSVEGSEYSGVDSCDHGSRCYDVDPLTNLGICVALCEGTAEDPICEDPSTTCTVIATDVLAVCLEA